MQAKNSPQRSHTPGIQNQRRLRQRLPDPSHRKRAEDMSMRNDQDVTLCRLRPLKTGPVIFLLDISNDSVKALDDVVRGSARGALADMPYPALRAK
jgi:ABC-type iron transport system FetAB ATPase subunit